MDIYSKIDNMFEEDNLSKVLKEIEEIKKALENNAIKSPTKKQTSSKKHCKKDIKLENFIKGFRAKYKEQPFLGVFPEFDYQNRIYGINKKGLLYDKDKNIVLSSKKAYEIYRYLYKSQIVIEEVEFF
jgi:hypothetical protein